MDKEFQVLAKNIKYLREKRGYTQEQLAKAAGLPKVILFRLQWTKTVLSNIKLLWKTIVRQKTKGSESIDFGTASRIDGVCYGSSVV